MVFMTINLCIKIVELFAIRIYCELLYSSKLSGMVNQLCAECLPNTAEVQSTLKSLSNAYAHVVHLHKTFIEESSSVIVKNVNQILCNELAKISETHSQFDGLSNSLDEALAKKAAVLRTRTSDLADARNALTAVGTCFAHTALDYVAQVNIAHAHKAHLILDAFWAFIKECSSFFSRGHAFFDEWTVVENGSVADAISFLAGESRRVEKKMQDRHSLVPKEVFTHPTGISPEDDVVMEGYLFKRSSNAFRTWNRRWFKIKDNKLLYTHRSSEAETPKIMELDLKLCLVRPAPASIDRACCFELVTPVKNHLLQADSELLCDAWVKAINRTITYLHEADDGASSQRSVFRSNEDRCKKQFLVSVQDTLLMELRRIPGNDRCADCGDELPKWASINLGILLCIQCCGIHRSFGVQVSKVRSLTMDTIEPEQRKLMLSLGNQLVNSIYLSHLPVKGVVPPRPRPTSARPVREAWIKAKYIERRFARKSTERARNSAQLRAEGFMRKGDLTAQPSACGSDMDLTKSQEVIFATEGNIQEMCRLIAEGCDVNGSFEGETALHAAVKAGNGVAVEFLLLNGAKINSLDGDLNSPLHVAAAYGHPLIVCQLMKRGADQRLKNRRGEVALDLAVEGKHADIVTLLRLQDMRDEFSEEFNNPMDEAVDDK
uniref:Arf-GAP with coiled-coil, ANK repeat and PH domain-containing protein 2 n=1 Tax=Syphacia muris TaxID=451379 RepID=A0A158R4H7_9BILA